MEYYTNNSFSHMQAFKGGQISLKYPQKLYIDLTQDCNMYCIMCRDKLTVTGKVMDMDLFKRIVDETASFVSSYSLFNWGEPLIVKDFRERVMYLTSKKNKDATIDISTNGILLDEEMITFLKSNDVIVTVSFDGANKETFEKIRRGGNFENICRNVENLARIYDEKELDKTPGIYVSIQKDNQYQLLEIAKLVNRLGIKRMGFGLVTSPDEYAPELSESIREIIKETKNYLDNEGMLNDLYPTKVGNFLWDGNDYYHESNYVVDRNCNAPFVSASIGFNGDIYLCCNVGKLVDNIDNKSFSEIWSGERYDTLRKAVNDRSLMPYRCKNCAWFNR
ncbi:hypothetical protein U472_09690 [Orenia metallireducens]|uniref:Radical SAM core domain-containing protein n=1 Tax=Orenia metallireducens TaxID=1413210 RepID=A0A1C0A7P1_9FIRM|nr:radical SAM protein [Orenia metallireducens]OCL26273.1 hypothetical protein U472_09690 [Orenia metallireducens]